ncbi:Mov34/MPN/PAD-1 family protein [Serratia sp. TSA_198.1]|uniref:Mov34/MPN/PAD-1 family protein n=1 Tax=Serratia sp. TSA_198.1 TaxID=3415664 RepID=UPI00404666FC
MTDYPGVFSTENFELYVSNRVIEIWQSYRQISPHSHEAFGVLIGSKSLDAEVFWLDDITTPMPDDQHTRVSFTMKDQGHQEVVNNAYWQSEGRLGYMGTWHTHPENYPTPSSVDLRDWISCSGRNQDRKTFFVIVGKKEIKLFFLWDRKFISSPLNLW